MASAADYLLIVAANFTHGRAGTVSAASDGKIVTGTGAGLRSRTLRLVTPDAVAIPSNASAIPANAAFIAASLGGGSVTLATDAAATVGSVAAKTAAYRAAERATLARYGEEWGEVKDAIQTALMWSFMYDPKEGLVAPMFQFQKGGLYSGFSDPSVDGETTIGLFCWDGSFAYNDVDSILTRIAVLASTSAGVAVAASRDPIRHHAVRHVLLIGALPALLGHKSIGASGRISLA